MMLCAGPATSVIKSLKVKFDNDLRWNGTNLYMEKDPDRPTYVGEPNRAIDAEWDTLLNSELLYHKFAEKNCIFIIG